MLTTERIAALTAVRDGEVSARLVNAPGSPTVYHPKEKTVALSFLTKAGLITTVEGRGVGGRRPITVELTERGERILSQRANRNEP